ncbi:general substrate transporter [Penicillium waksmanii]|uniref:general substrate transporter n=1 Tax=Penicillium waksmanii TaxID=69791 RepID=UPI0025496D74|nr:general substrate transporter [Penicillium waksmanii]KAJ5999946.1 general substrate transporter [Penicillium waksmanii]
MSEKDGQPEIAMVDDVKGESPEHQLLENERHVGLWKAAMSNKTLLLHCTAAFFAGMVFGYDSIVNGASISMPAFLIYFGAEAQDGSRYLPSLWTALWTSMSALLQALGGLGIGVVSDKIGRKWCCILACLVSVVGVGMQYAAESRGLLLGGKMVNGLAIGCLTASSTSWASEISTVRLRGPIQSAIVLFTVLMQAIGLAVIRTYADDMTEHSFRMVFVIQFVWPVATAIIFFIMPESPVFLILHNKLDQAKRTLTRIHGSKDDVDTRLSVLQAEIERERESAVSGDAGSYLEAFSGSNRKRSLTVVWLFVGVGLNGGVLLSQNVYFLIIAGLEPIHSYDIAIGGFGLAFLAIIVSWFYMESFGRRSLWLIGTVGNILVMGAIGGLYYSKSDGALWAIAILMNVLIAWQVVTMTSIGWVITAEISTYRLRGKTQSIAVVSAAFASWFFTFTVPYIYNTDSGNLGARTGFVFMGSSIVLLIGSYFLVPELQGFTRDEIDLLYAKGIRVREFHKYKDGGSRDDPSCVSP